MKKFYLLSFLLVSFSFFASAQNFWTGVAGDGLWSSGLNWTAGVPLNTDDVVLDNLHGAAGNFTVTLPGGVTTTTINTLQITPTVGNSIILHLPSTSTASPGFAITGPGDCIILNEGGILKNSSQAAVIPTIDIANSIRINNAGKYWHNTPRSATPIVDKLSLAAGTEYGIFEYDIPLAGSTAVALSGKTFGSLAFSAAGQGAAKAYLASGGFNLTVRGDFSIYNNATLNLQLTSNTFIGRHLDISGTFYYSPAVGVINRTIFFNGTTEQNISGAGTFTLGANFRNIEILANAKVFLQRDINLPETATFIINTDGSLYTGTNMLTGAGNFIQNTDALLGIGSPDGISLTPVLSGNIQTLGRNYSGLGYYEYNGTTAQITGFGLSGFAKRLIINNSANETVTLTGLLSISELLSLQKGYLATNNVVYPTLEVNATISSPNSLYQPYGETNIGWEKSFVLGQIGIDINTTAKKWAPVGKITATDTLFAPVAIHKFNTSLATYTAEYFPEAHFEIGNVTPPIDHVSSLEFWDISCDAMNTPDKDARITLSWRPRSKVGTGIPADDAQALLDLRIAHFYDDGNGLQWQLDGNNPAFTPVGDPLNYGLIAATGDYTTTFNTPAFTLASKSLFNVLPVKFLQFTAVKNNKNIAVQWQTKEEQNIIHYDIEKSLDGVTFEKTATLNAKNSILFNSYNHTDEHLQNGWNYYRLKITDAQHKSAYSKIIKVKIEENDPVIIYPNPVNNELKINLPPSSSVYTINIVNTSGQVVKRVINANSNVTINVESLIKGVYFLRIHNDLQVLTRKFTKQ
ncbi:MAG: T9SS type A sorting domain-containing protein [Chitinophagaceae bacterium]|nr:T9SS type A sorting domain-containing protein [Chitinophagaceae bacterium]